MSAYVVRRKLLSWESERLMRDKIKYIFVLFGLFTSVPAAAEWPTTSGRADRARNFSSPLEENQLEPLWSLSVSGKPSGALWGEIDGDSSSELVVAFGGGSNAWQADGAREWSSLLAQLSTPKEIADLDGDGRAELFFTNAVSGASVLAGVDGSILWQSPSDISLVGSVLLQDLDGDEYPEFLVSEADCGANGHNIGRTAIYSYTGGQVIERFRLEENTRDYNCSKGLAFVQLDGSDSPEIVAAGHRYLYVYSGSNGDLLEVSQDLGPIPYGAAKLFPVDVDGGGTEEILVLTDNSYTESNNSRRAMLIGRNPEGNLARIWEVSVADLTNDRHQWPKEPLIDLDGDGQLELVHSFFEHSSGQWQSFVRELEEGRVVASAPGKIVATLADSSQILISDSPWEETESYHLDGDALLLDDVMVGDSALSCSTPQVQASGWPLEVQAQDKTQQSIWLLDKLDDAGQPKAEWTVMRNAGGQVEALFSYSPSDNLTLGCDGDGALHAALFRSAGTLEFFDEAGQVLNDETITIPGRGGSFIIASSVQALALASGNSSYDASSAQLGIPVSPSRNELSIVAALDIEGDGWPEWLGIDSGGLAGLPDIAVWSAGSPWKRWVANGYVTSAVEQAIGWYHPWPSEDLNGDGVLDFLAQTGQPSQDRLALMAISGATGFPLWSEPFIHTYASSGAGFPVGYQGSSGPRVATQPAGQIHVLDGEEGGELNFNPEQVYRLGYTRLPDTNEIRLLSSAPLTAIWRAFDEDGNLIWKNQEIFDENPARNWGTGIVVAHDQANLRTYLAEGRTARLDHQHNLVILDVEDGAILHRVKIEEGQISLIDGSAATVSINPGVGLDAGSGQPPTFIFGGDDGWLYILDPTADPGDSNYPQNMLRAAYDFGGPLGSLLAADIDDDGFAEILVPGSDGEAIMLDTPELNTEIEVIDTNCTDLIDIDEAERTDLFCASWVATGDVPQGYVARLIHTESGTQVAGPLVVDGTQAAFEGLRMQLGQTYHVNVQAYSGQGKDAQSSMVYSSDGALIVDPLQAPELSLDVAPLVLVSGVDSCDIYFTLSDPSPLASYSLTLYGPDDEVVFVDEELLNTAYFEQTRPWLSVDEEGDPAPLGTYRVELVAEDFSGLVNQASMQFEVVEQGMEPETIEVVDEAEGGEWPELDGLEQSQVEVVEEAQELEEILEEVVEEDVLEPQEDLLEPEPELEAEEDIAQAEPALDQSVIEIGEDVADDEQWKEDCACQLRSSTASRERPFFLLSVSGLLLLGILAIRRRS